ncbi:putative short-chain dehydrogenase [Exidia glandulosa HHB12029]|uniref:Putative short-chain dehydrogenase n=1 Tax=Exidia glandulosa HHB12029 TaxID=1314781 RepID=A0A165FWG9_EXIGL|nr:putative short-chain dehydrogenase [Exidia glandulosa HHB12029]
MATEFGHSTTADEVVTAFASQVKGRVFLVTGPSPGGVGEATVLALARGAPAKLILVGRTPAKYEPVTAAVRAIDSNIDVRVYGVDLSSLQSVREGALKIVAENEKIDVLINNAAVSGIPYSRTVDDIETTFATNHVGPFLFTNMLMRLLLKSDSPRIVNLSSGGHSDGTGEYDDYNWEARKYEWSKAYRESKLANIHFTQYLAKVLGPRGVVSLSLHPGTIWGTSLVSNLSKEDETKLQQYVESRGVVPKTLAQGASTTLVAALDPAMKEHNGAYLSDCKVAPTLCPAAQQADLPEKLWRLSETLVKETFAY